MGEGKVADAPYRFGDGAVGVFWLFEHWEIGIYLEFGIWLLEFIIFP